MRFPLRWRMVILAGVAPAALALGTYAYLSKVVSEQVRRDIDDSLTRAALMFERHLAARQQAQTSAAYIIAHDPSFYSAVALPRGASDPSARATIRDVAQGFHQHIDAEMFEVWDRRGKVITSVGDSASSAFDRTDLVHVATRGQPFSGILANPDGQWQVSLTPVHADGMLVGSLLIGSAVGPRLAHEMLELTRGQVTFVANGVATASSLGDPSEVAAVVARLGDRLHRTTAPLEVAGNRETWVVLTRPLPGAQAGGHQAFVIQRDLGVEMGFLHRAQRGLLLLALLVVAVAFVLNVITAERITRPILSLVRGAEAMERGDYAAKVETRGNDEIAYLGARFVQMRAREREYVTSLEEVGRLKSEFIDLASHQLNTPIAVIKGFHDLFMAGALGEMTPRQHKALVAMRESVDGLTQLTEDAARMAQIEGERLVLDCADHSLSDLVDQAIGQALSNARGRQIEVQRHVIDGPTPFHVDGPRLIQALANLVRNGIRFTPDGGRVEVHARGDHAGCVLEVHDTGIGMTPDQQRLMLSRAFLVRDVMHHHSSNTLEFGSAGLGLGVAVARGIVQAHSGQISVESEPGNGTVVSIAIPRLDSMASEARAFQAKAAAQGATTQGGRAAA